MTKRLFQRSFVPVWLALAALLLCCVVIGKARFTADMSAFLPQAPTPEQQLLVDQLRDGLVSRLVLVGVEGGDAPTRAALSKAMAQRLRGEAQFSNVGNGEAMGLEQDQAFLMAHRYQLSPAMVSAHFTVDGLRVALGDTLDLLASPAGLLVKSLLPRDPTGELPLLLDSLDRGGRGGNGPRSADGVWVSRDAQRALLLLQTRAAGSDTDGQQQAMESIRTAFAGAVQAQQGSALQARLVLAGPGVFGVNVRNTIESEVTRLSTISIVVIAFLLWLIYRSFVTLALGLLPVLAGALAGVAAVSLGFGTVHGLTLGFGTTLIGEAVDYSIYLFVQSDQAALAGGAGKDGWVRRFWPTIRLGVMTSICGFSSLLLSGFPGLAQLGLYSIAGLVAAATVTRFVLPQLLPARFRVRDVSALGARLARVVRRAAALRWAVLGLCVLAALTLVLQRHRVWNQELAALSPVSASDVALDMALRADLGAPDVRYLVVVSGGSQEEVLQGAERVVAVLQPLVDDHTIAGVDSPTSMLPSLATQQARQASLPTTPELQLRLAEALVDMPLRAERLAPFVQDVEAARRAPGLQRADLAGTSLALAVDAMLLQQKAIDGQPRWSVFLPLHALASGDIDPARIRPLLATTGALFVDMKGESNRLYGSYLREAVQLSGAGLLAIVVLLAVVLRSPIAVLRVLAPLAGAVLCVAAALVSVGQSLTILHLVGLLLTVAVGSNYALFFSAGQGEITPRILASLLFANLTTVVGFGILGFSQVPVLQAMGLTVGPGAILALCFSAVWARTPVAEAV
ncbi:putative exporter [Rhodoferax ferrireducens]|uniref:Exporter n=1 Tax=Rhodoferax ferrireducens TaxID=192843 RepID=A0ABU2CFT2_9BURK|nr:MMPL family transporter [Rhodoferax ferrireducens]MDR7380193.1 putative exporter [Rhodoferax ferrireducens]